MEASEKPMEGPRPEGYPGWHEQASVYEMRHHAADSFKDRISGGSIVAGALVGIALQMIFIAFGAFLGVGVASVSTLADLSGIATSVGIWVAVSATIAAFIAGYVATRLAGVVASRDGIWHGVITWGLLIVAGLLLAGFGVTGVLGFGISSTALLHAFLPSATAFAAADLSTAASLTTTLGGWFLIGAIVSLVSAGFGGIVGCMRMSRRMEHLLPMEEEEERVYRHAA